jgi:hypothetical protein
MNRNLYDAISLNEDEINNSEYEKLFSGWVLEFQEKFGEYFEKNVKYFELRPNSYML